ncbi:MAG: MaoC family dehydratase N-terminal domain-containing protein [Actinomycetota bacterium]|nr:MaoC family dehydratase N-terminal domain-containing protein [Actinomycetota bacterium]
MLNQALTGKRYKGDSYEITAEAIARYSEATNDLNEHYRGPVPMAPPVFGIVPAFPTIMNVARDPELGADLLRLVHISEEHVIHRPLGAGDVLAVGAELASISEDETGERFTIEVELGTEGQVATLVRATMLIRGVGVRRRRRPAPTGASGTRASPEILGERPLRVDEDQPSRYAEASGDHNPIHLDEATAHSAKLPGVIVHGMCTMAMASAAVVDEVAGGDPGRIRMVAAHFAKPVFPGQELRSRWWWSDDGHEFDVVNRAGVSLLRGRAEVAN